MIRVLIAEDSATARALLVAMLSAQDDIHIVGEATTGTQAVDMAQRLLPDLITMDVHMPEMDGLEATKQIMARSPRPIIIVSTAARSDEVALSLEATRAGALMVLPKPEGPSTLGFESDSRQLVSMVRAMSQVKVVRRHGASPPFTAQPTPPSHPAFSLSTPRAANTPIRLVAIGASTGGPAALRTVLADLPARFPVPILIVQHIANGFTQGLAQWLGGDTALRVKVAELSERLAPATVYIAPDDRHLGCQLDAYGDIRILLTAAPPVGAFRPSASYLFQSVADTLGAAALGVILTGMGDDGVAGLRILKARGGRIIAQDEASSVIYGMPREAARAGVVDITVGINGVAHKLVELTQ
ncbi:MAG: chemotaxis-specific protein-glutamate methyltransferase CheB [Gemmatimonadota bacterium]|nr:chemotaxis-specific protein-glutamate methyltransferase CheB [Gemmatimonadota bacterium]